MMINKYKSNKVNWIPIALFFVLLIGTLNSNLAGGALLLNDDKLARYRGTGFWNDPCTWDGLAFGGYSVLCGTGSIGGCLAAAAALFKALKVDECFT